MHAEQHISMSWHVPPPSKTLRGKTLRQNRCAYHQSYTEGSSIEGVLADPLSGYGSPQGRSVKNGEIVHQNKGSIRFIGKKGDFVLQSWVLVWDFSTTSPQQGEYGRIIPKTLCF